MMGTKDIAITGRDKPQIESISVVEGPQLIIRIGDTKHHDRWTSLILTYDNLIGMLSMLQSNSEMRDE